MKHLKFILSIIATLGMVLATSAAQPKAVDAAKQIVETNATDVLVQMLSGVKTAIGEAYNFTKQELGNGYDFVKKQAPEVIQEFIRWQVAQAIVWMTMWGAFAGMFFYFARRCRQAAAVETEKTEKAEKTVWKRVFWTVGFIIFIIALAFNGLTATKCIVAPRIFIIEYVVDLVKPTQNSR